MKIIGAVVGILGVFFLVQQVDYFELRYAIKWHEWMDLLRQLFYPLGMMAGGASLLLGSGAKPPQREAGARGKAGGAVRLWFRCRAEVQPAQIDDCAVVALIGKQRVGAVAQKVGAHTVCPAKRQRTAQLICVFRRTPEYRRAADFESGMGCQRLLLGKRQGAFLQGLTQGFDRLLLHGSSQ